MWICVRSKEAQKQLARTSLSVLTTRIEESYAQEINLIGYLHQLFCILNELRCYFEGIAEESERDLDLFEESTTQPIVTITSRTRNGEFGRPRLALAREQLETPHGTVFFQLPRDIVARSRCQVTSVSSRLPPFSLIRDFGKQNTRGNVSKISVSLACYWQIRSKSTNCSH